MLHVFENSRGKQGIQNYLIHCFTNKKMNLMRTYTYSGYPIAEQQSVKLT